MGTCGGWLMSQFVCILCLLQDGECEVHTTLLFLHAQQLHPNYNLQNHQKVHIFFLRVSEKKKKKLFTFGS
ncbi:hypothetical protein Hanom_Chr05g00386741 [Helianthus anomalus]